MFDFPDLSFELIGNLMGALVRDRSPQVFLVCKHNFLIEHKVLRSSLIDRVDQLWKDS
jgi:hypothetical protein